MFMPGKHFINKLNRIYKVLYLLPLRTWLSAIKPRLEKLGSGSVFFMLLLLIVFVPRAVRAEEKPLKILIPAQVKVSGEEIFLRDVARILGGDHREVSRAAGIPLGNAPRSARVRWLYRSYVEYVLERSGWKKRDYLLEMPAKVKIVGASQELTKDRILKAVQEFLGRQAKPSWEEYWVEPVNIPELSISPGEVRLTFVGGKEEYGPGVLLLRLKIILNGQEYRTVPVTVRLHIKARVLIVRSRLERLQVLSEGDFFSELQEIGSVEQLVIPPPPGEYRVTRPLRPGDILKRRDLELIPEVVKDTKVTITVISGVLRLSMVGVAMEDGWNGDTIRIRNLDSNRVIMATVTGPAQLEVNVK